MHATSPPDGSTWRWVSPSCGAAPYSGTLPGVARVLFTSASTEGSTTGFIEAESLSEASAQLVAEGHTLVRFWSHPMHGDANPDGATAKVTLARVRVKDTWIWATLAAAWVLVPFCVAAWFPPVLRWFGHDVVLPAALAAMRTEAFVAGLFLMIPLFSALRRDIGHRNYRRAYLILWAGRLLCPPLSLLFIPWAAQLRSGRLGIRRGMRRYGALRYIGLSRLWHFLNFMVLDHLGLHQERAAVLESRFKDKPSPHLAVELALTRILRFSDAPGARRALAEGETRAAQLSPIWQAGKAVTETLVAIEERRVTTARAEQAMNDFTVATPGQSDWLPLLAWMTARAHIAVGETEPAMEWLRRATPQLLLAAEYDMLDRAASELAAMERAGSTDHSADAANDEHGNDVGGDSRAKPSDDGRVHKTQDGLEPQT